MHCLFNRLLMGVLALVPMVVAADAPRLLDSRSVAETLVPAGSLTNSDTAEWNEGGYNISVSFGHGLVKEVEVRKEKIENRTPPNVDLIARFVPREVNLDAPQRSSTENDGRIASQWWEWDVGDKVVRLQIDTYTADNSIGDKAGDLSSMRWMGRPQNLNRWW